MLGVLPSAFILPCSILGSPLRGHHSFWIVYVCSYPQIDAQAPLCHRRKVVRQKSFSTIATASSAKALLQHFLGSLIFLTKYHMTGPLLNSGSVQTINIVGSDL
ncbi:hypothetical protein BKA67DRAFT_79290 [Truncatella angustata]|uniref:Uncharacterized protein n=1 Tax=Truncatella angustata TaxID=152316 RepID=A0A9P8UZI1_9PEZI|nr:uncharacterized protein BKA67DRAFT_79290 [Truncatella angustata]KAH6661242.1 hypothetical protein BKA67DRAFT_79290 [Truncatella angustata]